MHAVASIVTLSYAALLVAGGIVGWRVSGSRISLTASLVSAALLSASWRISLGSPGPGYLMGTIVSLALAVLFTVRFRKTKKFMPSGMLLLLSIVVTVILAWSSFTTWSG